MNAAGQRRLTPWLGALALGLAGLWAVLLGGVGRTVRWDAPRPPAPLPPPRAVALPAPTPLEAMAVIWQRPLFTADRKPAATAAGVSLGDLELTGIILTPGLKMALLHDKTPSPNPAVPPPGMLLPAGNPGSAATSAPAETGEVRVREGASLPDGSWRLVEVKPRSAVFAGAGGRTELSLPVTAPLALARPGEAPAAASTAGDGVSVAPSPAPRRLREPPRPDASALERMRLERLREAVQARRGGPLSPPPATPPPTDPSTPPPSLPAPPAAPRAAGTTHPREP